MKATQSTVGDVLSGKVPKDSVIKFKSTHIRSMYGDYTTIPVGTHIVRQVSNKTLTIVSTEALQKIVLYVDPSTPIEILGIDYESRVPKNYVDITALAASIHSLRYHSFIGSDPEIFATTKKGELVPAFEFLQSKKENPHTYWDGYQAEFTVAPHTCMDLSMGDVGRQLDRLALAANNVKAVLTLKNTFEIPQERLKNDDPKFVQFGCTPSSNAYGEESVLDIPADAISFRSAGGHMHFSLSEAMKTRVVNIVKELDRILGVISVSMFSEYDDARRRMYYGRAGEYRTPPHGLEYRVLSNAWLAHPVVGHLVFELARNIIGRFTDKDDNKLLVWDVTEEEARECINNCDVELARELIARNSSVFDSILMSVYGLFYTASREYYNNCSNNTTNEVPNKKITNMLNFFKGMVLNGSHTVLSKPFSVSSSWMYPNSGTAVNTYGAALNAATDKDIAPTRVLREAA